jgi:predicted DNA repair protein MutK
VAGSSLLALLDDIASVLDDVAVLTKLAAKKTAGVLGDDLAVNAEQVSGVQAERELPVVLAVAKGSAINKAILVPVALGISVVAPWLITPLLMVGGAFLCFEGFEKIAHKWLHDPAEDLAEQEKLRQALADDTVDLVAFEKTKIKGAVRTDFVLSAEIIAISLGEVAKAEFTTQVIVLVGIAVIMTVGVYGFVAGIVKMDDLGLFLTRSRGAHSFARVKRSFGGVLLKAAPYLMKTLAVAGTVAMFLVGGGILTHGLAPVHHWLEAVAHSLGPWGGLATMLANAFVGVVAGAIVTLGVKLIGDLRARSKKPKPAS